MQCNLSILSEACLTIPAELRKEKGSRSAKLAMPGGIPAVHSMDVNSSIYQQEGAHVYCMPPVGSTTPGAAYSSNLRESAQGAGSRTGYRAQGAELPSRSRTQSQTYMQVRFHRTTFKSGVRRSMMVVHCLP